MPDIYIRNFRPNSDHSSNRIASFDFAIGPITVKGASVIKSQQGGTFISMPSSKSESNDRWYDHVEIDELTKLQLRNQLRQLMQIARQADPEVPDRHTDEDVPY